MPTNRTTPDILDFSVDDDFLWDQELPSRQITEDDGIMPPELVEYQESVRATSGMPVGQTYEEAQQEFKDNAARANFLGFYTDEEGKRRYLQVPTRDRQRYVDESDTIPMTLAGREFDAPRISGVDMAGPPSYLDTATKGLMLEAPRNVAAFVGSAIDRAGDVTGFWDTELGPAIEDNMPSLDRENATDGTILASDTGAIIGGLMGSGFLLGKSIITGGSQAASRAAPAADRIWGGLKTLANLKASEVIIGAAMDSETDPLLLGEDGLIASLTGIAPGASVSGAEEDRSKDIFNRNLNIMADGIMVSGILGTGVTAVQAVSKAGKVLIAPMFNLAQAPHEKRVLKDLAERLAIAEGENPSDVVARIAEFMENPENRQVIINLSDQMEETTRVIQLDPVAALRKGVQDGKVDLSPEQVAVLNNWQNSIERLAGQGSAVSTARARPSRELEAVYGDVSRSLGEEAPELSRQQVVEHVTRELNAENLAVANARTNLEKTTEELADSILNDPALLRNFSQQFNEGGQQLNLRAQPNQIRQQLVAGLKNTYIAAREATDAAFSAIKGGPIDSEGLIGAVRRMGLPVLNEAGAYGAYGNKPTEALFKAIKPPSGVDNFTDEDLVRQVSGWLEGNNITFETLYTELRPTLGKIADRSDKPAVQQALRDFIKWIDTDALEHVARSGDGQVAENARIAMQTYKERVAPWADLDYTSTGSRMGGTLAEFRAAADTLRRRETAELTNTPQMFEESVRKWTNETFVPGDSATVPRVDRVQAIIDANSEHFGNPEVIPEYLLADALTSGADHFHQLRAQGVSPQEAVRETIKLYQKWGEVFSESYPSFAGRIQSVINSLGNRVGDVNAAETALTRIEGRMAERKQQLINEEFADFFRNNNIATEDKSAQGVLRTLMRDPDNKLGPVLELAENNPVIRDGLRAAWLREAKDRMFAMSREASGNKPIRAARVESEFIDDDSASALAKSGRVIFGEDDPVYQSIMTLAELGADTQLARQARVVAGDSSTLQAAESRQQAKRVINDSIMATFGPLTRTGARIRLGANRVLDLVSDKDPFLVGVSSQIAANPDEFARVMSSIDTSRSVLLDRNARNYLLGLGARAGFYTEADVEGAISEYLAQSMLELIELEKDYSNSASGRLGTPMPHGYSRPSVRQDQTQPQAPTEEIDRQMQDFLQGLDQ